MTPFVAAVCSGWTDIRQGSENHQAVVGQSIVDSVSDVWPKIFTLDSGIDIGQRIIIELGKFGKKNKQWA